MCIEHKRLHRVKVRQWRAGLTVGSVIDRRAAVFAEMEAEARRHGG